VACAIMPKREDSRVAGDSHGREAAGGHATVRRPPGQAGSHRGRRARLRRVSQAGRHRVPDGRGGDRGARCAARRSGHRAVGAATGECRPRCHEAGYRDCRLPRPLLQPRSRERVGAGSHRGAVHGAHPAHDLRAEDGRGPARPAWPATLPSSSRRSASTRRSP
jgi:hypothetical protein